MFTGTKEYTGEKTMELVNGPGTLYLCATPIGNLKDITERVLETLRTVDIIAAEDTRNSLKLLTHFDIKVPLTSYHEYNKYDKANELIDKMLQGKNVALITDAGTPAISDPGEVIARMCREAGIRVTSLPGACAMITALSMSGISSRRFCFEGFLPPDKKIRKEILTELENESRTIIIYESPHHLVATLKELNEHLHNRNLAICRELTKKFEEVRYMFLEEAIRYYENADIKGEFVLVIEGMDRNELKSRAEDEWKSMDLKSHMEVYEKMGLDRKECMKRVAKDRGITKRDVYEQLLNIKE